MAESTSSGIPEVQADAITNDSAARVQTVTGDRLPPPIIRVERSRCVGCGADPPDLICKQCKEDVLFCKKCARRAKHPHPLKAFRAKDDRIVQLRKHLTLSYYEHIVSCENEICMESCEGSRYTRIHFKMCQKRPRQLSDMITNGKVQFNAIGSTHCNTCGLFITCMFIHANTCQKSECNVEWCQEIRNTFDYGTKKIYVMTDEMKKKCEEVHIAEWKKVEDRKREMMIDDLLAISI
uniref:B box-type domain-containing protein n=1 Tax=Caenorhabditis tropicalis TaxID=1561998 RepID=A0A1I7TYA3_9PELO